MTYDDRCNLTKVTNAAGQSISIHNPDNTLNTTIDQEGNTTNYSYENGQLTSITGVGGRTSSVTYENGLPRRLLINRKNLYIHV
jgi:YD repeat-containing protein